MLLLVHDRKLQSAAVEGNCTKGMNDLDQTIKRYLFKQLAIIIVVIIIYHYHEGIHVSLA
ncbi:hypothetical protein I7I53_06417 [Histoplasma capsulatum var. duboisii H88]|uniref:Uncharacterized protein n=2 Tax=Ajellomyces capsulatus TaxID=5037 RepID=A0A8H7Z9D9_AJECA|nr:hypothetical protein I7I52_01600 [Histoplasma capsulatum]QSS51167.1 hypothetical protein I7I53_06417 [Histoplasma capsulatum var. duboisii H88]QSS69165.1 hypothetical protein I7I50_10361 [Histoplasma capsulatum G186AR]